MELAGLRHLAGAAAAAVSFFFVVLLVGFAYEWKTGALDWVRAVTNTAMDTPALSESSPRAALRTIE